MKCDPSDFESFGGDVWCGDCLEAFIHDDDELPFRVCKGGCNLTHLSKNLVEKLDGFYCEPCAKAYEEKLLVVMA